MIWRTNNILSSVQNCGKRKYRVGRKNAIFKGSKKGFGNEGEFHTQELVDRLVQASTIQLEKLSSESPKMGSFRFIFFIFYKVVTFHLFLPKIWPSVTKNHIFWLTQNRAIIPKSFQFDNFFNGSTIEEEVTLALILPNFSGKWAFLLYSSTALNIR